MPRRPTSPLVLSLLSVLAVLLIAACTSLAPSPFDGVFGPSDPTRFDTPPRPAPGPRAVSYRRDVQPVLDRRCVVCHACYDAPCQVKTTSWEGLARGASKTPVYDPGRLLAAAPSRLYVDAQLPSEWRGQGFFPVLNEHAQTVEANRTAGLMHRLLMLKQQHPGPTEGVISGLDLAPDRAAICPAEAEIGDYERRTPLGGMPFGLPRLAPAEHSVLTRWLEQGAPVEPPLPLPPAVTQQIAAWEHFFNGDDMKTRLFARYAFEHLFLGHLYFGDLPDRNAPKHWFRLVRSTTPPGQPVQLVLARRPVDDPGVARVYYRLVEEPETIVAKTHMPYALDARRQARWRELFLDPDYVVDALPGYTADTAANPFATFAALPAGARYRFMLDEAQFTIMGFVKSPVCRGQIALNVIEDQFWVSFLAPNEAYDDAVSTMLGRDANLLQLPSGSSNTDLVVSWLRYADLENDYLKARTAFLTQALGTAANLDLRLIWNGDGRNPNAALTVFRHFDSASVVRGFVGDTPKTAWVIGYPVLERIHYLLVADYDVYGNVGHQLSSRLYMDYLRAEGEFNFLALLPQAERLAVRDHWYRGVDQRAREQVYGGAATTLTIDSGIHFKTDDPRTELLGLLKARLAAARDTRLESARPGRPSWAGPLATLAATRGRSLEDMPETTVLVVEASNGTAHTYTLLRNTGHASVSHLLEQQALLPDENTLTVVSGILGAYPNAYFRVPEAELPAFAAAVAALPSAGGTTALAERWGVRRTDPAFWAFNDALNDRYARDEPLEGGVLDANRLENR